MVADVVLKRARAVSNWDIAGKRQLNSTSDTNRYYIMRNRGFLARYMQIYGDYHPMLFRLGNAATFCRSSFVWQQSTNALDRHSGAAPRHEGRPQDR